MEAASAAFAVPLPVLVVDDRARQLGRKKNETKKI
jgi:hypothetical protein